PPSPPLVRGGVGEGLILAGGSRDGTAKLWRVDAQGRGTLLRSFRDNSGDVLCVALSPDRQVLATGSRDGTIYLWDAEGGGLLEILAGHAGEVLSVAFSADGGSLASGGGDRTVKIWRAIRN
ncbi:serine/threonine protein kinase, partial [Microcoleus sp. herbarium7]